MEAAAESPIIGQHPASVPEQNGDDAGDDSDAGHSDESNEEEPNLKSIWTTLASGSARSRRARPCILDVCIEKGKERVRLNMAGESTKLANKKARWMFTASTCECCGVRERELLCPTDTCDSAKEDFYNRYPKLKAVEVGTDARRIGRIELMFEDGDTLSVGLECNPSDTPQFLKLCASLASLGQLEKCTSSGCKTRRPQQKDDQSPEQEDDPAAQDEADRHMMELLAGVEFEGEAKTKASERKRQKKKKTKSNVCMCESPGCMCEPVLAAGSDEPQEHIAVGEDASAESLEVFAAEGEPEVAQEGIPSYSPQEAERPVMDADRHMMELLAGVDIEGVAKARASERKRLKRKRFFDACMCKPEAAGPAKTQDSIAASEQDLEDIVDRTAEPRESTTEADDLHVSSESKEQAAVGTAAAEESDLQEPEEPDEVDVVTEETSMGCSAERFEDFEEQELMDSSAERFEDFAEPDDFDVGSTTVQTSNEASLSANGWSVVSRARACSETKSGKGKGADASDLATNTVDSMVGLCSLPVSETEQNQILHCASSRPLGEALSTVEIPSAHCFEQIDAPIKHPSVSISSIGVQTDLPHFDAGTQAEQHPFIASPSHIGEYMLDESTSPLLPMIVSSVVPRAKCVFPLDTPAQVQIYKKKWGDLRIPSGFTLKKTVDRHSYGGESSDEESEPSTIHCQKVCCNPLAGRSMARSAGSLSLGSNDDNFFSELLDDAVGPSLCNPPGLPFASYI